MQNQIQKIAILGCAGFIGSHLLERLLKNPDFQVEGWDTDDAKIRELISHPRLIFHQENINGNRALLSRLGEFDVVISLAAICNPAEYNTNPLTVMKSNFIDAHELVDECARQQVWLMHFSTCEVYGRTTPSYLPPDSVAPDDELYLLSEDTTPLIMGPVHNQRWCYAAAKQLLERYIYAHHYERGLEFTIIRPFNFLGPKMDYIPGVDGEGTPRVLACFASALLRGEPMKLVDGGLARRTFIDIDDVTEILSQMLERPEQARNEIFNIGNRENEVTIAELADVMRSIWAEITGDASFADHPIVVVDSKDFYGPGYEDCDRRVPDLSKLQKKFGWTSTTGLRELLTRTLKYYRDIYAEAATLATAHGPDAS